MLLVLLVLCMVAEAEKTAFFQDEVVEHDFSSPFSEHPLLFFSGVDVITLRRFANTSHAHLTDALKLAAYDIMQVSQLLPPKDYKQFGRSWNEGFGNNLPALAMYVMLNPSDTAAFVFIRRYMDRLEHYRHWQVLARFKEDLPVACILTGFATSLDMLYAKFDQVRAARYMDKVKRVTQMLYESSLTKQWGHKYLNHRSITNYLAIFIGSLVIEPHYKDTAMWKRHSVIMLERNLQLLSFVRDGTFSEGLGYGTNSFRGISQYLYLLRRHLRLDHSSHPWLQKHIDFYLHAALPGLRRTLGVGDTYAGWVYGPESQLHFLDTFIKKTGKGHWMAAEIRKRRDNKATSALWYQKYATLHTEFIWYNPNIRARPPGTYASSSLHEFKDWGVVVYRGGALMDPSSTFLSFKSGKLHGAGIYELVHHFTDDEVLDGWNSFNPSHQHPDQNSFTFWILGVPFITDGLYGPKYPHLDNTLMFAPSASTPCSHPYAGQTGSCGQYFKVLEAPDAYGQVIVVSKKQGYVFTSGEAAHAYHKDLGLESYYRCLLLLHKELLVILDHVHVNATSRVSHVSASFNNHVHEFKNIAHSLGLNGLGLRSKTNSSSDVMAGFQSLWLSMGNKSPFARITELTHPGSPETGKAMWVSNAKITFELEGQKSRMLYIFHGPNVHLRKLKIIKSVDDSVSFAIDTGYQDLVVTMATDHVIARVLCSVTDQRSETTSLFTQREPESSEEKETLDVGQWESMHNSSVLQKFMLKLRKAYEPKETGRKVKETEGEVQRQRLIANLTVRSAEYYARIKKAQLLQAKWSEAIRERKADDEHEWPLLRPDTLWYSLLVIALSNLVFGLMVILLLKLGTPVHRKRLLPVLGVLMGLLFVLLFFY